MNIEKTNLDRGNCFIIEEKKYLEICNAQGINLEIFYQCFLMGMKLKT